jgi:excisionase family DNA binding protein
MRAVLASFAKRPPLTPVLRFLQMTDTLTAPPTQQRELLSTHEVASLLGVTAQTVRNMVRNGDLPGVQLGGHSGRPLRISASALNARLDGWETRGG